MKYIMISAIALASFIIVACSPVKKSTGSAAAAPATPAAPVKAAKSSDGIFIPGVEELTALQVKYKEVTMQTLTDGHAIYVGACTNCHMAKSIYSISEEKWPGIIDDMAPGAKLTDVEKDAVYKFVLSIKATQPEETKKNLDNYLFNYGAPEK